MTFSAPTLPPPFKSHLNHIPAPPTTDFTSEFNGLLPPGGSIPSSWGQTRYYDFSPSGTPPPTRKVLLVHGVGTPALGLAPLARKLTTAGNHVVAYDLWSHGLSSTPLAPHTPALIHTQLLEVLSHLQWTTAHLLGFSFGGSVVASFAAGHPRAVESVTLVAPAGLWRKAERPWVDAWIVDGGWGREWLSRRRVMQLVGGSNEVVRPDWKERLGEGEVDTAAVQRWEREGHGGYVAGVVSLFRYGGVYDEHKSYRLLEERGVKALVVLGEKDGVFDLKEMRDELEQLGWTGEIKVVEGATHEIVRSHVESVAELVEHFWKRLGN